MNKSKEIQEQYLNLRYKVQGKIKELEGKLSEPNTSNLLLNNNPSILPRQAHCHHNCHHPHYCHSTCSHNAQFFSQNHIELSQAENHNQSLAQSNSKNSSVNEMISSALVQSLKNQRQINDHIKAINEKIQTLSAQHNRSNLSDAFSQSVSQNKIRVHPRPKKNEEQDKHRSLSQVKSESHASLKVQPKRIKGLQPKKVKTKIKQNDYISSSDKQQKKSNRNNNSKSKSLAKNNSQYFLSFGCPIHSPSHQPAKSPSAKEIYKDSQYRNRKHEKNHLIQSFKQQQKSRKRLISKIAHNVFKDYGRS